MKLLIPIFFLLLLTQTVNANICYMVEGKVVSFSPTHIKILISEDDENSKYLKIDKDDISDELKEELEASLGANIVHCIHFAAIKTSITSK